MVCQPAALPPAREDGRDWVDIHICRRLKAKRILTNMSQERLATALGISYQQLQRYEAGKGRLPCSMLYRAAAALGVPITYFFDQLADDADYVAEQQLDKAAVTMLRGFQDIPDVETRRCVARLIDALGKSPPDAKPVRKQSA